MDIIKLRPANINDLDLVNYWDTKQHVIDCDPDDDWNWEVELQRSPAWREQLIAELDGESIGMVQIIDPFKEETHYWGDVGKNKRAIDIWIGEEKHLNKGYGTVIMKLAIQRCFANADVKSILIDPLKTNTKAHRFYERLGFEFVAERIFEDSICYVFELKRKTNFSDEKQI
jgi:aminoglycoside 6'-N-acetyltransferase